ncbi:MAG: hypothetical protein NC218_06050 [Acetobacter sp.]|nr:hypothetical protein [Acetobacter sp.]
MTKISKYMKYLIIGSFLFGITCQKAEAFLPIPPTFATPVVDVPDIVGKTLGAVQSGKHTLTSGFTFKNAFSLNNLKGGLLDKAFADLKKTVSPEMDKKGKAKNPGKGSAAPSTYLQIDKDSVNEEQFFNAYHTLFFTHNFDGVSIEGVSPELFETAYKNKAEEYKQDVIIDTYISAQLMEDYLATVDKTLDRLEECQTGKYGSDEHQLKENCTFFGMTMAGVIEEEPAAEGEEGDNKAQLAATRNAYIVTMVHDRLLRIIEDLTAAEAIFQSARQLGIAKPISEEKHSSADNYVVPNYHFAYNDSQEYTLAKGKPVVNFNNRINQCKNGSNNKNCPQINDAQTEAIKNIDDTSALQDLKKIEEHINKAMTIHNLKNSLPELKSQYRQYLLQKEIHNKTKKLVENSEKCVVNFLTRHGGTQEMWYGGAEPQGEKRFDYETRGKNKGQGIAGELIYAYDQKSTNIALGTSNECEGYYQVCPSGYTMNMNETCTDGEETFYACEVASITEDIGLPEEEMTTTKADSSKIKLPTADTDGFMNGEDAEAIEKDSRKNNELTWSLGSDKLMDLTKNGQLTFKPWNDQKLLQAEYLRNKYRNIRMIISSTDQAVASFKIADKNVKGYTSGDDDLATKVITAAANCKTIDEAKADAQTRHCGGYDYCNVKASNGIITISRKNYWYDSNGKKHTTNYTDIVEDQRVSLNNTCEYKKTAAPVNPSKICFTPSCLVQTYFSKAWNNADGFYQAAKGKGRVVATDKLKDVITERTKQDTNVQNLIREQQAKIKNKTIEVNNAIANLTATNKAIDSAKKKRNAVRVALENAQKRIFSIKSEITTLNVRAKDAINEDKCAIEKRIAALKNEQNCIENGKSLISHCDSCKNLTSLAKEERDCSKEKLNCNAYLTTLQKVMSQENEELTDETQRYLIIPQAQNNIKIYDSQIAQQEGRLEGQKKKIAQLQEEQKSLTENFAEKYIEAENKAQQAIENKNYEYEKFTQDKKLRMKKGKKEYKSNNLETTFSNVISSGNLNNVMKKELDRVFFTPSTKITSLLTQAGVPNSFVVDESFKDIIGLGAGSTSAQALATKLKDTVVQIAAKKLETEIKNADKKVGNAVEKAESRVSQFSKEHNISGETKATPTLSYLEKPSTAHSQLLKELISYGNIDENDNLFGIPEDYETQDDAFFVGLPARGNNYQGMGKDENRGRDYKAPQNMLSSLPPLREVFYFSAAEYDEIPQNKGSKPVLTELLNCKYFAKDGTCAVDYLPEIWLHILARPNLRADKKYQQTFVERSFDKNNLNLLVTNKLLSGYIADAKDAHYHTIISRAGVYPCKLGSQYIDMGGGDKVENMKFQTRTYLSNLPNCQEIEWKGNKIYHLLADHGTGKKIKDTETPNKPKQPEPLYEKYSELGQLLRTDLRYRPLQKNIQEYLKNEKNTDNNITRQKAELASFKRNTFGSFLDAVTAEYNARKTMESSKQTIEDTMENLCEQLKDVLGKDIDNCKEKALATSSDDKMYFEKSTKKKKLKEYRGIDCANTKHYSPFYNQILCDLDSAKAKELNDAQNSLKQSENKLHKMSSKQKKYFEERLQKIKNYIDKDGTLVQDSDEVTAIRPDMEKKEMDTLIKNAESNLEITIGAIEDSIQEMKNQTQATAYCPIY